MNTHRILKQGSWYLLGNLVTRAAFFAATLLFTRLFVPEAFGTFVLVKTVVVFAAVLDTWLIECIMRFHPQGTCRNTVRRFNRVLFALVILHVSAVSIPACTVLDLGAGPWVKLGRYALFIYLLDFAYRLNLQLLRVRGRVGAYNGYSLAYAVSRLVLSLTLVLTWQHDITALLLAWLAVGFLLMPIMSSSAWRLPPERTRHDLESPLASVTPLREMAAYGMPFVGLALGWTGLYLADRFMLQAFRGSAELGLYGVNYSFAELAHFLPYMLISFPAYPVLVKLWEDQGLAAVQENVCRLARPYLLLAIPLITGTSLIAPRLLTLCTTPTYASAATAIAWMAPGLLGWGLLAFFNIPFMLLKRPWVLAALGLGALIMNVLLNFAVIPAYGLYGAAGATSATYLFLAGSAWWVGARVLRMPIRLPGESFRNALLASGGMALLWVPLTAASPAGWPGLAALVVTGVASYGIGLLVLREFSSGDLELVSRRLLPRAEVRI